MKPEPGRSTFVIRQRCLCPSRTPQPSPEERRELPAPFRALNPHRSASVYCGACTLLPYLSNAPLLKGAKLTLLFRHCPTLGNLASGVPVFGRGGDPSVSLGVCPNQRWAFFPFEDEAFSRCAAARRLPLSGYKENMEVVDMNVEKQTAETNPAA